MVVTSGRPQAVKYKLAFDKYIKKHNLEHIKALVAFSGKVEGKALGDDDEKESLGIDIEKEYTEYNLNPDASGDLRNEFERSEYRVMIVANKFQTGFNQPKLVAMYLDKKVSGVEAVQTLSRLNRTYPGKDETYVIDFVNDPKTILDAKCVAVPPWKKSWTWVISLCATSSWRRKTQGLRRSIPLGCVTA